MKKYSYWTDYFWIENTSNKYIARFDFYQHIKEMFGRQANEEIELSLAWIYIMWLLIEWLRKSLLFQN